MSRRHKALFVPLLILPLVAFTPERAGIDVRSWSVKQRIDGFGFSQAFRRNELVRALSPEKQREILDLWLSRSKGAGFSILRLGIGSSPAGSPYDLMVSIQPENPGGPTAKPKYVWDGDDGGQVWLAKEAKRYGVERFYADAWSAPGYMKTNGSDSNGGELLPEWRQAYADYLVQYARFYAKEGIRITDLGFTNEPDLTVSYASMRFTPQQAADFVKVLGPTAARAGIKVACCDAAGWSEQRQFTEAIEADPVARRWVATHTGHPYVSPIDGPLPTDKPVWMSEWSPNGDTWNENWDDGSGYDGFAVAQQIHDSFTTGNVNGYVFWFGASRGATRGMLQIDEATGTYRISKRFWALAAYSRFIRPDAVRVDVTAADPALKVTAFRNRDGSEVVEILNTAATEIRTKINTRAGRATVHLTDGTRDLAETPLPGRGPNRNLTLAPRSLTTLVVR
ncbi:glycoside hydrolase family 30 protein [Herbidospora cretacea]|uniref:glycoside hydrolase family 30 protein n=1 Tax=Herbidospora cretacea TaxID=28444 RepID=UPI000774D38F|nr:glycoside hydrolase [Herbidospora cretacea]